MRIRLGLKIWSPNVELAKPARELHDRGELDYIELFCYPDSFEATFRVWQGTGLPFVIHAPHSMTGLNFAKAEMRVRNSQLAQESFRMADALHAEYVIFHPGADGDPKETVEQASALRDPRMLMENKPFAGLGGGTCHGSTPEELEYIIQGIGCGFCLDFGHAMAAALSHRREPLEFIRQFNSMGPAMFHMTDGDEDSELDRHDPFGQGSFPLADFLALVPDGAMVTDEAKRKGDGLGEYLSDRSHVRFLLQDKEQ